MEKTYRKNNRPIGDETVLVQGRIPAWAVSVLVHLVLLILLGVFIKLSPVVIRGASAGDETYEIGIVRKLPGTSGGTLYQGENESNNESASSDASLKGEGSDERLSAMKSALDTSQLLPDAVNTIGAAAPGAAVSSALAPNVGLDAQGAGNRGTGVNVGMFGGGVSGKGNKFVFVFDRSDSMADPEMRPIRAAKNELLATISALEERCQFSIVFFNQDQVVFKPGGSTRSIPFASERNKAAAETFIESIQPSGGTNHRDALYAGFQLNPDVIFFLTDGDKPELTSVQIQEVVRRAGGIRINVIQFGTSKNEPGMNFLKLLAAQTGGMYHYVPVSSL